MDEAISLDVRFELRDDSQRVVLEAQPGRGLSTETLRQAVSETGLELKRRMVVASPHTPVVADTSARVDDIYGHI